MGPSESFRTPVIGVVAGGWREGGGSPLSPSDVHAHKVPMVGFLLVALALLNPVLVASDAALESGSGTIADKPLTDDPRFYFLHQRPSKVSPVRDYRRKDKQALLKNDDGTSSSDMIVSDRPDFLYSATYPHFRVVAFYAHWCPTCQGFAPKYVHFAQALESLLGAHGNEWAEEIELGTNTITIETHAVSCAANKGMCEHLGIQGVPHVLLLRPFQTARHGVAMEHWKLEPFAVLKRFRLLPDRMYDDGELDENGDPDEEEEQMYLDVKSEEEPNLIVRGKLQAISEELKVEKHEESILATEHTNIRAVKPIQVSKRLRGFEKSLAILEAEQKHKKEMKQRSFDLYQDKGDIKRSITRDAHRAVDTLMRNVISQGSLKNETGHFEVLQKFLRLLYDTLPSSVTLHTLVQELLDRMETSQDGTLLQKVLETHTPPRLSYTKMCRNAKDPFGCGLWQVILSSSVGIGNIAGNDTTPVPILEAATVMRDALDVFAFTSDMAKQFVLTYDEACGKLRRCPRLLGDADWKELPLWMAEMCAETEGMPVEIRQGTGTNAWPPIRKCPTCWKWETRDDGSRWQVWDRDVVYQFLRLEYWLEDDQSHAFRMKLWYESPEAKNRELMQTTLELDSFDMEGGEPHEIPMAPYDSMSRQALSYIVFPVTSVSTILFIWMKRRCFPRSMFQSHIHVD